MITGHTGFKGSWLCWWLKSLGATICGYALDPNTTPNLFDLLNLKNDLIHVIADIRDYEKLKQTLHDFDPEIIFHLAAQPLVRDSYDIPRDTYEVNVMGTVNVLEIAKTSNARVIVNITTDKCYENKEWLWGYRENEALGGLDPYSSSKACSELVTQAYRHSFYKNRIALASARAGNVIGGGDWSKDRLIPDIIRAYQSKSILNIRNPQATRPWQHVLEPLSGYLMLAEKMHHFPQNFNEAWNFGPAILEAKSVATICDQAKNEISGFDWQHESHIEQAHEACLLQLDSSKALQKLAWQAQWNTKTAVQHSLGWYKEFLSGVDAKTLCTRQLAKYNAL